jgi:PAT family beta-lactamase induction signal transducer AmpG
LSHVRPRLPVWLLGFGNLPIGLFGALSLVTVPQLLAADGVAESAIASVTAIALIPTFASFLVAPVLDWRLSRRTYAILLALLTGLFGCAALLLVDDLVLLTVLLFLGMTTVVLNQAVVGAWFGSITSPQDSGPLGAWLTVANFTGLGGGAVLAIFLLRTLPAPFGPAAIGGLMLLPLPIYWGLPGVPPDPSLARQSVGAFLIDVLSLLRERDVRWLLFLFAMPAASFALANTLGGLGKDFAASEQMVATIAGAGVALAGVFGSLVVPPLARGLQPRRLYLAIGIVGALFTLCLTGLPLTPTGFAVAMLGENLFQAAGFAVQNVIVLRANGGNNPLAATQFALLSAAPGLPLSYMQAIDGHVYDLGGISGSYLADALISLAACAVLVPLFWRRLPPDAMAAARDGRS